MPTIPAYLTPEVSERPTAQPYEKVDRSGSSPVGVVGAALQGVGNKMAEVAKVEKAKADTAAILQAESDYVTRLDEIWAAPEVGLSNFKGAQIEGRDALALNAIAEARSKIAEGLNNDDQRQEFMRRSDSHLRDMASRINGYAVQQRNTATLNTIDIRKKTALDAASLRYNDPEGRNKALEGLDEVIAAEAKMKGLDDAGRDMLLKTYKADVAEAVLSRYLDNEDASGAREFFAANKEELGVRGAKYEKIIGGMVKAKQTEDIVAGIIGQAKDPAWGWVDSAKALEAVEKMPNDDPKLKEKVRELTQHQIQANDSLRKKAIGDKLNEAVSIYERTGRMDGQKMAQIREWMLEPANGGAEEWMRFEKGVHAQNKADRYERNKMNAQALAYFRQLPLQERAGLTDSQIEGEYASMGADQTTRYTIRKLRNDAAGEVKKGGVAKESEFNALVAKALPGKTKSDKALRDEFMGYMARWRSDYIEQHNGDQPTRKEVMDAIKDGLLYGDEGGVFSKNRYKFQGEENFKPFNADEQPYSPNKAAAGSSELPDPAEDFPEMAQPVKKKITRTNPATGETKVWNGTAWVKE